jgi:hypothetical protein
MTKREQSHTAALHELTVEMAGQRIAASAEEAMHPQTGETNRKLAPIKERSFRGYACSWCGCRFPEPDARASAGAETNGFRETQRQARFVEHVCSDRPHASAR